MFILSYEGLVSSLSIKLIRQNVVFVSRTRLIVDLAKVRT